MSKNSKLKSKARIAKTVTAAHKAGRKLGRTTKLHTKMQIYPKGKNSHQQATR